MASFPIQRIDSFSSTSTFASLAANDWHPDTPYCESCRGIFTLVRRRHHCRKCGRCVCGACSPNKVQLEGQKRQQRVCTPCITGSMQTVDAERFRGGAPLAGIPEPSESASLSQSKDVKAELSHVYEFLTDFADRLEDLHGQDTAVQSFSLSPRLKAKSDSWKEFDPDKAIARCEACLTALHKLHGGGAPRIDGKPSSPTIGGGLVAKESEAELQKLRGLLAKRDEELLAAREAKGRVEIKAQETLEELEYGLVDIVGKVAAILDAPRPSFESADSATNCRDSVSKLQGFISEMNDSPVVARRPSIPSVTSNASSVLPVKVDSDSWEENTEGCTVCGKKLGKRNLHRRHHCRACGKCVCSSCSPSLVKFSEGDAQRVCTPCVNSAFGGGG